VLSFLETGSSFVTKLQSLELTMWSRLTCTLRSSCLSLLSVGMTDLYFEGSCLNDCLWIVIVRILHVFV
jgi:hypothetical protein